MIKRAMGILIFMTVALFLAWLGLKFMTDPGYFQNLLSKGQSTFQDELAQLQILRQKADALLRGLQALLEPLQGLLEQIG
ncbi:MAG: hypothetical protein K6C08_00270 [Oscillospiraceae bacterium]|nr:hypothetical protein [Oscillospiraceae bacterium]